jgi:hypothetical protein
MVGQVSACFVRNLSVADPRLALARVMTTRQPLVYSLIFLLRHNSPPDDAGSKLFSTRVVLKR